MKKLFVISGSSGVGKGTVIKEFLKKHPEFKLSISCTTRGMRAGEVHGENYFFVEECLKRGDNLILEIDTKGALNVKKLMPEAVLIFIAPPSIEELEARLRGRHTETEEAIQKRLASIKLEIKNSKKFDCIVVNDTVENAVSALERIML